MTDTPKLSNGSMSAADIAGLLAEHQGAVMGYLMACLRQHADAEDVFQEVSVAAIDLADQLRDREGFLPWVRQIARFRVLKHVERSRRLTPINAELIDQLNEVADEMDADEALDERARALNDCLDRLPDESRRLILTRYADGSPSVEEIAGRIGRTVQATYALLKRIRMTLRECADGKLAEADA